MHRGFEPGLSRLRVHHSIHQKRILEAKQPTEYWTSFLINVQGHQALEQIYKLGVNCYIVQMKWKWVGLQPSITTVYGPNIYSATRE